MGKVVLRNGKSCVDLSLPGWFICGGFKGKLKEEAKVDPPLLKQCTVLGLCLITFINIFLSIIV